MTSPGLDITQLLANLRKKSLESQGTPPDQDKPPMDQNKLMSIIAGGGNQSPIPPPQPTGGLPGTPPNPMQQIAGGDLGARPSGQATLDFQKMIGQEPMRTDPNLQPSGKRKFGAVMAALGSGILNRNIGPAMDTYRTVRNAPFNEAERNYQQKLGNLAKSADVEQAMDEAQRKEALGQAQVKHFGAQSEAEKGRQAQEEATAAYRRAQQKQTEIKTPASHEQGLQEELQLEAAKHPDKPEKLDDFAQLIKNEGANYPGGVVPTDRVIELHKQWENKQEKKTDIERYEEAIGRKLTGPEIKEWHRAEKDSGASQREAELRRVDRNRDILVKPYQKVFDDMSSQLTKIDETERLLDDPANGPAVALGIPKLLTSLVSGQGTGIRITDSEQKRLAEAGRVGGDFKTWLRKVTGQSALDPQQIQQVKAMIPAIREILTHRQDVAFNAKTNIYHAEKVEDQKNAALSADEELMGKKKKMSDQEFLQQLLGK